MGDADQVPVRIRLPLVVTAVTLAALVTLQLLWLHPSSVLKAPMLPYAVDNLVELDQAVQRIEQAAHRALGAGDPPAIVGVAEALAGDVADLREGSALGALVVDKADAAAIERAALALRVAVDRPAVAEGDHAAVRIALVELSERVGTAVVDARSRAVEEAARRERHTTLMVAATVTLGILSLIAATSLARLFNAELQRQRRELEAARSAHGQARYEAAHDPLTGLPNRRRLQRELETRLAAAQAPNGVPFAIHMVDLDGLKTINDDYGHAAGDRVLQALGRALAHTVRRSDFIARLGGDEFVVLQQAASPAEAEVMQQRLAERVRRPVRFANGGAVVPSASIGTGIFGADGRTADTILAAADRRLYARKPGRSRGRRPALEIIASGY